MNKKTKKLQSHLINNNNLKNRYNNKINKNNSHNKIFKLNKKFLQQNKLKIKIILKNKNNNLMLKQKILQNNN